MPMLSQNVPLPAVPFCQDTQWLLVTCNADSVGFADEVDTLVLYSNTPGAQHTVSPLLYSNGVVLAIELLSINSRQGSGRWAAGLTQSTSPLWVDGQQKFDNVENLEVCLPHAGRLWKNLEDKPQVDNKKKAFSRPLMTFRSQRSLLRFGLQGQLHPCNSGSLPVLEGMVSPVQHHLHSSEQNMVHQCLLEDE